MKIIKINTCKQCLAHIMCSINVSYNDYFLFLCQVRENNRSKDHLLCPENLQFSWRQNCHRGKHCDGKEELLGKIKSLRRSGQRGIMTFSKIQRWLDPIGRIQTENRAFQIMANNTHEDMERRINTIYFQKRKKYLIFLGMVENSLKLPRGPICEETGQGRGS